MTRTHVWWVAYHGPGGTVAAGQVRTPGPITDARQVLDLQTQIAAAVGLRTVVVTGWTLLRVEDTDTGES